MRSGRLGCAARLVALGALAIGVSGAAAQTPAPSAPLAADAGAWSAQGYREHLARWHDMAAAATTPEQFALLRDELSAPHRVTFDGTSIASPPPGLVARASAAAAAPGDARARQAFVTALARLRDDAAAVAAAPAAPRLDNARGALARILDDSEFRTARSPSWLDAWRERIGRWITAQLMRLLGATGDHPLVRAVLSWMTIGAALLALSVLAWRMLRAATSADRPLGEPVIVAARGESWESWFGEAKRAAREGNARACLRAAHWAAVHRLEDLGVWRLAPSRTPREYVRALPPHHGGYDAFRQLSEQFERAWYGRSAVAAADIDAVFVLLEQLGCHRPLPPTDRS